MWTVVRLVASIALFLLRLLILLVILLGCVGLGGLIGFGLTMLASRGIFLIPIGVLIGSSLLLVLTEVMKQFGLGDPRGLVGLFCYSGMIIAPILRYSATIHRPWWIALPLGVICIILGIIVRFLGPPSNPLIEPGDHISFTTRLILGDRTIGFILVLRERQRQLERRRNDG